MKNKRTLFFRLGAVLLLLAIAGVMMRIGRGHTVYMDNKTLEYNGQTYDMPYKIEVEVDGERVAKLYGNGAGERGMTTCIGQKFVMTLTVTQEKSGGEETVEAVIALPYSMDGVAINLPAYLAGLPEEAYLSEFQVVAAEPEPDGSASSEGQLPGDEGLGGEFTLGDDA